MDEDSSRRDKLLEELQDLMMRLGRRYANPVWSKVTPTQFLVLRWLAEHGPAPMGDLADALGITMAGATGLVDRLIHHGLVERDRSDKDRRLVLVRLTELGRTTLRQGRAEQFAAFRRLTHNVPEADLEALLRILRVILQNLNEGAP
ncbi:MAG: MarR family transcriptional regulator [Actinomycetia bacterium]|jgi:DNA-binding MarR family transcriptional regulator|nr:MarR family transcriptional regulator [Actinomycetes bacterium]